MAWGLIEKSQTGKAPVLLWVVIVVAPLIRYECLTISSTALLFLFLQKESVKSVIAGIAILILLALFSWFLLSLGLGYLPESVFAKSNVSSIGLSQIYCTN